MNNPFGAPLRPHAEETDASIIGKVRKWNVMYDGGTDPMEFIERMEELAGCYEIPVDRLARTLPDKLKGRALEWYRNNRNTWQTWVEFTNEFRTFFLPRRYRIKLEDEVRKRLQGVKEKGKEFVTVIQTMYRRLGEGDQTVIIERIYDNLRTEYRHYIKPTDFRTMSELVIMIERYEELVAEQVRAPNHGVKDDTNEPEPRIVTPKPPKTHTNPFIGPAIGTPTRPYNRETDCWRCSQPNHSRFQCTNPQIQFCSRCGVKGPRTCACRSENANGGPAITTTQ